MRWLDGVAGQVSVLQGRIGEARAIETQASHSGSRQGGLQLRNTLSKAILDINQQIAALASA
jgi:hypothetical protein